MSTGNNSMNFSWWQINSKSFLFLIFSAKKNAHGVASIWNVLSSAPNHVTVNYANIRIRNWLKIANINRSVFVVRKCHDYAEFATKMKSKRYSSVMKMKTMLVSLSWKIANMQSKWKDCFFGWNRSPNPVQTITTTTATAFNSENARNVKPSSVTPNRWTPSFRPV